MADGNAPGQAPGKPVPFKGIGHWHAQARQATEHGNPFIELHDAARLLSDAGLAQSAQLVQLAFGFLRDSNFDEAAEALRAAARAADAKSPAYAQGLRNIADELPESDLVGQQQAKPRRPRRGEDTESLPALDGE